MNYYYNGKHKKIMLILNKLTYSDKFNISNNEYFYVQNEYKYIKKLLARRIFICIIGTFRIFK